MLKFQQGDKFAFEELLDKYQKPVINFIYRMIQNKDEADDLAQDVFIRVYNSAKTYRPTAKFSTWIYTIARNICLNELRKKERRNISLDQGIPTQEGELKREIASPEGSSPYEDASKHELQELVKEAIESLPVNQRMAVVLRRYQLLSYEEIAKTMDCSVSAVKSLLNRAKESLKEKLKSYVLKDEN
ncbi:MAG: sigma-70 family RNA polymerase sigma factor [Candidatus Omnitrophica bacterium]|nr:sigma-70 family RNA polymerase sigma factor [Candidatus Omnitrophota bacterium]